VPAKKRTSTRRGAPAAEAREDAPKRLTPEETVGRIVVGVEKREGDDGPALVLRFADGECVIPVAAG
jgi:hypothetical protein